MQVDVLHGDDLCIAAAGCTALDAEHGSQGGLTQGNQNIFIQLAHTVSQTNGGGGLAFAGGSGVDGGDQNQLAVGLICHILEDIVVNLCLILAILLQILFVHTGGLGNLGDGEHLALLRNFNVSFESHVNHSPCIF